ncbi:MarR family winged helix-turn-helix transcriptional regulator [Microbacterium lushaniae]|uniref:MarR family transcriptional regulator n=1 Tax=Microbacterium lushaniae TaxID=2614639 RepID=A0A5J6L5T4_9MICO|nr:MarR family transcriptional regulator [Microbacterium lushaniae]QEW03999.1 MarR family transcriptional regulator [Microbacterium lushaniae]
MTDVTPDADPARAADGDERTDAINALEGSFSELVTVFRRLLAEAADTASPGMLPGTFKVLSAVNRLGPVTLSALAERLTADKGLTSRSVSELEGLGFVVRTPDPLDRRSRLIAVTPLGTERLAAARTPHSGRLTAALADWSVEDIRHAAVLLSALATGRAPGDAR